MYPVYNIVKHDLLNCIKFLQFSYNEIFIAVDRLELASSIYVIFFSLLNLNTRQLLNF